MRVLLDTNCLVSAFLQPSGAPGRILDAAHRGVFELILSTELIEEVEDVTGRPHIRKRLGPTPEIRCADFLRALATFPVLPSFPILNLVSTDPDDNHVISAALAGGASHLVTGDKRDLLPLDGTRGLRIISPADFLALLDPQT